MRQTFPSFYPFFACTASACTDNCCIGWEIGIDPAALADYQSQPGAFGDRLRAAIQPGDPPFFALTKIGRCPFLNEENLCDIYRQLGESHLCAICDQHPRFHNWFGAEKESGLGLSCEEAARLILFSAPPRLLCRETPEAPDPDTELDPELLAGLRAVREAAFSILAEPSLPLAHRLALLAALGQDLQHWMDAAPQQAAAEGCTETRLVADAALALAEFYGDRTGWPGLIDQLTEAIPEADLSEFLAPLLELLESLPPNHAHWPERLAALRKALPHRLARPLWESPEQEQAVLAELGSPEKVAAIIKANVPGSRIPPRYQAPGAGQAAAGGAARYANPPQYPGAAPKNDNRTLFWVAVVAALLILSPLWLSVLGTVFGALLAVIITAVALVFSGAAVVIAGIIVTVKGFLTIGAGVGTALLVAGMGVLDVALGFAMLGVGFALCMLLVWLWRMAVRGWNRAKEAMAQKKARGNEQ